LAARSLLEHSLSVMPVQDSASHPCDLDKSLNQRLLKACAFR
jgi:hypothetical protein